MKIFIRISLCSAFCASLLLCGIAGDAIFAAHHPSFQSFPADPELNVHESAQARTESQCRSALQMIYQTACIYKSAMPAQTSTRTASAAATVRLSGSRLLFLSSVVLRS